MKYFMHQFEVDAFGCGKRLNGDKKDTAVDGKVRSIAAKIKEAMPDGKMFDEKPSPPVKAPDFMCEDEEGALLMRGRIRSN